MGTCGATALGIITASLAGAPATLGTTAIIALLTAAGCLTTAAVMGAQVYFMEKDAKYYFNLVN